MKTKMKCDTCKNFRYESGEPHHPNYEMWCVKGFWRNDCLRPLEEGEPDPWKNCGGYEESREVVNLNEINTLTQKSLNETFYRARRSGGNPTMFEASGEVLNKFCEENGSNKRFDPTSWYRWTEDDGLTEIAR